MLRKKALLGIDKIGLDGKKSVLGVANISPVCCNMAATVSEAIDKILEHHWRIPVVEDGKVVGILTGKDVLDFLGAGTKFRAGNSVDAPVESMMSRNVYVIDANSTIEQAMYGLKRAMHGGAPVTGKSGITGIVSDWDFVKHVAHKSTSVSIGSIMTPRPVTTGARHNILETAKMMVRGGFKHLPVIDGGALSGMIAPTDILRYIREHGIELADATEPVANAMTSPAATVKPDADVGKCVALMSERKVGGLLVVADNALAGIVTKRDVFDILA